MVGDKISYVGTLTENHRVNVEMIKQAKNNFSFLINEAKKEIQIAEQDGTSDLNLRRMKGELKRYEKEKQKLEKLKKSELGKALRQERNPNYKERQVKKKPDTVYDEDDGYDSPELYYEIDAFTETVESAFNEADNKNVANVLRQILQEQLDYFDNDMYSYIKALKGDEDDISYVLENIQTTLKYYTFGVELDSKATEIARALSKNGTGFKPEYADMIEEASTKDTKILESTRVYTNYKRKFNQ